MKVTDFDCHRKRLGLTNDELAMLTGFTSRMVAALAHLREAWIAADGQNARAIEHALRVLFAESHSLHDNAETMIKVLLHSHERGDEMLRGLRP